MRDSRLKELVRRTYKKTPFFLRWLCWRIYGFVQKIRIDIWIISDKDSLKTPLSIIYAGSEKHKNYIAKLAFDSSYSEIHVGRTWLWNLTRIIKKRSQDYSLMVLEVNKTFLRLFKKKKCFYIPRWINGEVDISVDISSLIKKESLKSDVRKIKKNNLQFEVTNEECQFDYFYYSMYLPYINKVHGNKAILMTHEEMKKKSQNCDLLLIKNEKDYIAGTLIYYEKNIPRIWSIGIKDGNTDYLKIGVLSSLYYFAIKYLKQKGYKKVNFGLSRAFLKDGVLQYKKKWGLKIVDSTKKGFLTKPLSSSVGTKRFFIRNPFIYIDQDKLTGAIFFENDQLHSEKNFKRLYKDCNLKGVSKYVVYLFGDNLRNMEEIVPAEFSDRITICSAESLFK